MSAEHATFAVWAAERLFSKGEGEGEGFQQHREMSSTDSPRGKGGENGQDVGSSPDQVGAGKGVWMKLNVL